MMRGLQALALFGAMTLPAKADGGPVLVIPGRPGVPIIISGRDASYAVVEGDWGLARGIHVQPTVYGGRPVEPLQVGHYFPSAGHQPGYGRLEIEPPARRGQGAESYHRSYAAQSTPHIAEPAVPLEPPQVIMAPPQTQPYPPRRHSRRPRP